jgi:hypothetical protein
MQSSNDSLATTGKQKIRRSFHIAAVLFSMLALGPGVYSVSNKNEYWKH